MRVRSAPLLRRGDGDRLLAPGIGKEALQVGDLGQVVDDDVGIGRVADQEVLVIALGRIEALERVDAGDDRAGEGAGLAELGDIGLGDPPLLVIGIEDGGAVLRALIRPLLLLLE